MRTPVIHQLKCHPEPFEATRRGDKHAELRINDRGFLPGDFLVLSKWIPPQQPGLDGHYTGEHLLVQVTHALHGPQHGIAEGYAMLSHHVVAVGPNVTYMHNLETAVR